MKRAFIFGFILILFAGVAFVGVRSIDAQTSVSPTPESESSITPPATTPEAGINLTLSPTFLNLVADPGEAVSANIRITNNNTFTEYLTIDIAKFEAAEGGDRPLISEVTEEDGFQNWVEFDQPEFTIAAGETRTVRVTITPPETASLGYYYAFIVNRLTQQENQDQGAVIAGAPAFLTLLEVRSPNAKRELQLTSFVTDKVFYEFLPATFKIRVKNTGNIHLAPAGDIFIDSMREKDIGTLRANEARANVLPGTEREYTVQWDDAFATWVPKEENGRVLTDENNQPIFTVNYDYSKANKFRLGKYTANLILTYNNGERDIPLEATVSFWVIPVRIIALFLAIVVTPALLVYFFMKWRYKKR